MIDPSNITNYNLTYNELEEHILFWVCAAGKNGHVAARNLEALLSSITYNNKSPFVVIKEVLDTGIPMSLPKLMQQFGIGCYNNKARTFKELINSNINLRTCSTKDLESIYGIGMKTSRCFIMHSRYNSNLAGLDTHILKYLKYRGVDNVPKSTPTTKKQYLRLEKEFLNIAIKDNIKPTDLDLKIWNKYAVIT